LNSKSIITIVVIKEAYRRF